MDKKGNDVPYLVYEGTIDRLERAARRLWILCIVIFLAFVASNAFWIWYDKQYQIVETTTSIEAEQGDGTNIVNTGDLDYGAESENNQDDQEASAEDGR